MSEVENYKFNLDSRKFNVDFLNMVLIDGGQRNNFVQLIEVIKQKWKFYLNLCYEVI